MNHRNKESTYLYVISSPYEFEIILFHYTSCINVKMQFPLDFDSNNMKLQYIKINVQGNNR